MHACNALIGFFQKHRFVKTRVFGRHPTILLISIVYLLFIQPIVSRKYSNYVNIKQLSQRNSIDRILV